MGRSAHPADLAEPDTSLHSLFADADVQRRRSRTRSTPILTSATTRRLGPALLRCSCAPAPDCSHAERAPHQRPPDPARRPRRRRAAGRGRRRVVAAAQRRRHGRGRRDRPLRRRPLRTGAGDDRGPLLHRRAPDPPQHHRGQAGHAARPPAHRRGRRAARPIRNATVEVWHCDAQGDYSGYDAAASAARARVVAVRRAEAGPPPPTSTTTYLRGAQRTGRNGLAEFASRPSTPLVPGRTHAHPPQGPRRRQGGPYRPAVLQGQPQRGRVRGRGLRSTASPTRRTRATASTRTSSSCALRAVGAGRLGTSWQVEADSHHRGCLASRDPPYPRR